MENKKKANLIKRILGRKKLLLVILIAATIIGFGVWKFVISPSKKAVETTEVKKGTVAEELILSGEINADEYAKLTFPTSGEISWVGVKEGDTVKKGQALAKLDTTVLNTTFQQARATLREEEATVANIHDQVKDHTGDETYAQKDTRTTAEATKDKAYESYIAAEYNLRHATLTSPFAGIVSYLAHPFSGVNVLLTETQAEVINPDTIYFDVKGDQNEVPDLSVGQKVNIVLDSIPEETFEGAVDFIGYTPKVGEVGSVYEIKVKFITAFKKTPCSQQGDELNTVATSSFRGNPALKCGEDVIKENLDIKKFRIGMSGDANFVITQKEDVLYAPPKFISSDTKGKFVRLGRKNNKVYIETGVEGEERVEIKNNLKEGDVLYD